MVSVYWWATGIFWKTTALRRQTVPVELEHTQNGRQVTYIASAGELVAMLITNYDFSPAMKQELQRLEDNGVSFLVSTTDPNVTAKLVSDRFGLFFRSVKVLGAEYAKRFKDLEEKRKPPPELIWPPRAG